MAKTKRPGKAAGAAKVKGKPTAEGATSIAAPSEVATTEQRREAMQRLIDADKTAKAAGKKANSDKSKYRNAFKEAMKFTGFTDRALSNFMKDYDRDPTDIDAETRETNAVHLFWGTPIGAQLGTLDNGASVASSRESERDLAKDGDAQILEAAEAQGEQAGLDGESMSNCGYPEESKRRERWNKGWLIGQAKIADGMGGTKKSATHQAVHA